MEALDPAAFGLIEPAENGVPLSFSGRKKKEKEKRTARPWFAVAVGSAVRSRTRALTVDGPAVGTGKQSSTGWRAGLSLRCP